MFISSKPDVENKPLKNGKKITGFDGWYKEAKNNLSMALWSTRG
jgi:hypothetical protein